MSHSTTWGCPPATRGNDLSDDRFLAEIALDEFNASKTVHGQDVCRNYAAFFTDFARRVLGPGARSGTQIEADRRAIRRPLRGTGHGAAGYSY